ncbi:MAG: cytochrome c [Pseudomonadota bacterium]|nr:cytochrome c [Pseudomonadota bacterium]
MNVRSKSLSCIGAVLALLTGGGAAAQTAAADAELGRQLYMSNGCYSCHGTVGQGGERSAGPRIAPGPYPLEAFRIFVRSPRESMPRYDPKFLSDAQLEAIHRYLVSLPRGPAAKDITLLQPASR